MTNYVAARDALDRMHVELTDADEERHQLHKAVKAIQTAALEPDPHLALDMVRRRCAETLKAWDARREDGR